MGKEIFHIYKQIHQNWTYPSSNTTFFLPQHIEPSIQTQYTSAYDASVGSHTLASSLSDQRTFHHVNTYFNNNGDSWLFETPRKKITVIPVLVIVSPHQPYQIYSNFLNLEESTHFFKLKGKLSMQNNFLNQEH